MYFLVVRDLLKLLLVLIVLEIWCNEMCFEVNGIILFVVFVLEINGLFVDLGELVEFSELVIVRLVLII